MLKGDKIGKAEFTDSKQHEIRIQNACMDLDPGNGK
jgi:hypothetical protein